jgi:uncharacterized protein YdaU (DUF1376 family)
VSEFPSLPLFTDSFIADTGHLTAHQTGAYLMLLMMAWRMPDCRLPDDDLKLARWARVAPRQWPHTKPVVMEFWTLKDGFWSQKRLMKERDSVRKYVFAKRGLGNAKMRSLEAPNPLENNNVGAKISRLDGTQQPVPTPNPIKKGSTSTSVDEAAREASREGKNGTASVCRVIYSDTERKALAFEFDGLDVDQAIDELDRWCDRKLINDPIDRKSAIYGGLRKRHGKAHAAETLSSEAVTPSPQLTASRLTKKRRVNGKHPRAS